MRVAEPADGDFGLYGNNIMEYSGNTDPHQKIANGSENRFKFGLHFKYTEYSISTEYVIKTTKENCIHKDLFISLLYVKNEHEKKVTGLNFTFCLTFQGKTFLVCWLFSAHCLGSLVLVAKNQWH